MKCTVNFELFDGKKMVVFRIIIIEKLNADRTTVLVKREAVFFENKLLESLVLRYKVVRSYGGNQCAQLINNGICVRRMWTLRPLMR